MNFWNTLKSQIPSLLFTNLTIFRVQHCGGAGITFDRWKDVNNRLCVCSIFSSIGQHAMDNIPVLGHIQATHSSHWLRGKRKLAVASETERRQASNNSLTQLITLVQSVTASLMNVLLRPTVLLYIVLYIGLLALTDVYLPVRSTHDSCHAAFTFKLISLTLASPRHQKPLANKYLVKIRF